jgi:hypothetical protein
MSMEFTQLMLILFFYKALLEKIVAFCLYKSGLKRKALDSCEKKGLASLHAESRCLQRKGTDKVQIAI